MSIQLASVNLITNDPASLLRFYTEILGLALDDGDSAAPTFYLLRAGSGTVTIQDAAAAGETPGAAPGVELGFAVSELDDLKQRLEASGYPHQAQTIGWGSAVSLRDPDGNRLNVFRLTSDRPAA
jgi:catechol 2,3-dioxygenase-like lactoylglutathione lyase family enzyme